MMSVLRTDTCILLAVVLITFTQALPVAPEPEECQNKMADIVFALDSSFSLWPQDFELQLQFVKKIVSNFEIGKNNVQVGVITFGTEVHHQFDLHTYTERDELTAAIRNIKYVEGGTNTGNAIKYARDQMYRKDRGSRKGVAKILVVITDGLSVDPENTSLEASIAVNRGIEIFAVGVGEGAEDSELKYIASRPSDQHMFRVEDFSALESIQNSFTSNTCQGMISDVPVMDSTDPQEPQTNTYCGGKPADVIFVLDCSSSITEANFGKMLNFVQGVTDMFDLGPDRTRVGVVSFSDGIHPVIPLNNEFNRHDLMTRIANTPYLGGGTNTGSVIHYVRKRGFASEEAREGVAHVAILVTDGQSANMRETVHEAEMAKRKGINIFALGIGDQTDKQELRTIASQPVEKFMYQMTDFDALVSIQETLAITTCETGFLQDWPGTVSECPTRGALDVMFVFDSFSMGKQRTKQLITTISSTLVPEFEKVSQDVKIGSLLQTCHHHQDIPLGQFKDGVDHVSKLACTTTSGLAGLLHRLRRHGYKPQNGGRQSAEKVAVIFVDAMVQEFENSVKEAKRLKFNGRTEVFVVAVGPGDSTNEAREMVSEPVDDHLITLTSYDAIRTLPSKMHERLCRG